MLENGNIYSHMRFRDARKIKQNKINDPNGVTNETENLKLSRFQLTLGNPQTAYCRYSPLHDRKSN